MYHLLLPQPFRRLSFGALCRAQQKAGRGGRAAPEDTALPRGATIDSHRRSLMRISVGPRWKMLREHAIAAATHFFDALQVPASATQSVGIITSSKVGHWAERRVGDPLDFS